MILHRERCQISINVSSRHHTCTVRLGATMYWRKRHDHGKPSRQRRRSVLSRDQQASTHV